MAKAAPPPTIGVYTDITALSAIEPEWRELALRSATSPFALPSYSVPWAEAQDHGHPLVITASIGDQLVGLLPLYSRKVGSGRVVRWLGHGLGSIGSMLLDPDVADAGVDEPMVAAMLWDGLADACPTQVALQLTEYCSLGRGLASLRRSESWDVHLVVSATVYGVDINGQSVEDLLAGPVRRKLRQSVSRSVRRADDHPDGVDIVTIVDSDGFERHLADIEAVFDASEAHRAKIHLLQGSHRAAMLTSLRRAAAEGDGAIFLLRVGNRPVAFDINVVANDTMFGFLRRHDPVARDLSPGHLLMRHELQYCADRGIAQFDLGIGDDSYKRAWATSRHDGIAVTGGRAGRGRRAQLLTAAIDGAFQMRSRVIDLRERTGSPRSTLAAATTL